MKRNVKLLERKINTQNTKLNIREIYSKSQQPFIIIKYLIFNIRHNFLTVIQSKYKGTEKMS